jgi:hypothetical protein
MYADNRGVEHLDGCFVSVRHGAQEFIPDACRAPSVEAVVAGRVRTVAAGQVTPRRPERRTQKMPFNTRLSSTRGMPRGLLGRIGLIIVHSLSVSS